jgi:poly-gamma-glutamate synthesis protein (capsule biosynthesis protein)
VNNDIKIVFGGDFFLGREYETYVIEHPQQIWGDLLSIFKNCDFSTLNLEAPVTNSKSKIKKTGPHLKLHFETLNALKAISLSMVTLSNNHINDFGIKGVMDTIENCRKINIKAIGAGANLDQAKQPIIFEIKGKPIAFINVSENEWNSATKISSGSNPFDIVTVTKQLKAIKKFTKNIFLIIHGGHEHYQLPNPKTVTIFRFLIDMGARAIISHHTHCFSGYEIYNGSPIFYGLGNLLFPFQTGLQTWLEGFIIDLTIHENDDIDFKLHPYTQFINKKVPMLLSMNGKAKDNFYKKLNELNRIICNEELLQLEWDNYIKMKTEEVMSLFVAPTYLTGRLIKKLKLSRFLISENMILHRLNQIRCESHYELSKAVLQDFIKRKI